MKDFFDKMLDCTMGLVAIPSVEGEPCEASPFGQGVGDALDYVEKVATSMGMTCHNEHGYYLTADIGEGECVGIMGHLDVVPVDNDWSHNPWGEIVDGKIFGRGILDDKGPMMCCLWATHQLLSQGKKLNRKIRFLFGGNEESGWGCIERYNQVDTMPPVGFSPDGDFPVINCEKGLADFRITLPAPSGLVDIRGGSRPNVVMADCSCTLAGNVDILPTDHIQVTHEGGNTILTAVGKPAHASTPQLGDNALWHILSALKDNEDWAVLHKLFAHNDGSGVGAMLSDDQSGDLTFNVGTISSFDHDGTTMLDIMVDLRIPVSYTIQYAQGLLQKALPNANIELKHFHNPLFVDKNDDLVTTLLSVYNDCTGQHAEPIAIGGGTYARAMPHGVAFGPIFPGMESTIHQKDECVEISTLRQIYDIYLRAIDKLCFED